MVRIKLDDNKICFYIISYLPQESQIRYKRCRSLIMSLNYYFNQPKIILLAQNYTAAQVIGIQELSHNITIIPKDKLTIPKARNYVLNLFRNSNYDGAFFLDDDSIIWGNSESNIEEFISFVNKNQDKYIYLPGPQCKFAYCPKTMAQVPMANTDAEISGICEDYLYFILLSTLYPDSVVDYSNTFFFAYDASASDTFPSTWYKQPNDDGAKKTELIAEYIRTGQKEKYAPYFFHDTELIQ